MLFGRNSECAAIEKAFEQAQAGIGSAVLVRGEAGIGKSALLDFAQSSRNGFEVLTARGVQAESELPFAGLADLLRPVVGQIAELPEPQRLALSGAFAIGPPAAGDRFAVAAATLGLLARVADDHPLMCVVDDAHWIDDASREALLFAARRLGADPVVMLVAVRDGETDAFDDSGLPEVSVGALDRDSADALIVRTSDGRASPEVRARLYEATAGNPLALVEMTESLSDDQLNGQTFLGEDLPPAERVERAFVQRVAMLGGDGPAAMLVAAAGGSDRLVEVEAACQTLGIDPAALVAARRQGLLRGDDDVELRHPLLRSAVYRAADVAERRRAHAALADAVRGPSADERRIWHLAAAAHDVDEQVASALAEVGRAAASRGGLATAARALERAARLTPDDDVRARRLYEAAQRRHLTGASKAARALLEEAAALSPDELLMADIDLLRGQIETWQGEMQTATARLTAAAERIAPLDHTRQMLLLIDASLAALLSGQIPAGTELARRAHAVATELDDGSAAVTGPLLGNGLLLSGQVAEGLPLLLSYEAIPAEQRDPAATIQIVPPLTWVEEYGRADALLRRLIEQGRARSSPSMLVPALGNLAELDFRRGRWQAGYAEAAEALSLARDGAGQMLHVALIFVCRFEAARGLEAECRAHVQEGLTAAMALQYGAAIAYTMGALGLLELGLGNAAEAAVILQQLEDALDGMGVTEPTVVTSRADLAEALIRSGRPEDARAVVDRLAADAEASGLAWPNATARRCAGLLAGADDYASCFEDALTWHARVTQPFETARTELCYGERLRRDRRPSEARRPLERAIATFERLGATPWSERARSELAATGERRQGRGPRADSLTPRELQVALVVAGGATNREAAASLFLTEKTIEFHLGHIYRKLGVRSRTELANRLPDQPETRG